MGLETSVETTSLIINESLMIDYKSQRMFEHASESIGHPAERVNWLGSLTVASWLKNSFHKVSHKISS